MTPQRLRLLPAGPAWPYSDAQLRADEPATLFPPVITDADREAFDVITPVATEPPAHDPAAERAVEIMPLLVDGTWTQQWELVAIPPAPPPIPQPDWSSFKSAMLSSPTVNAALVAAMPSAPSAVMALPAAVMQLAAGGDSSDFRACWLALRRLDLIPQDVMDEVTAAAQAANLPQEVIGSLGGTVLVRARNADGTYVADDPSTPDVDEAWVEA